MAAVDWALRRSYCKGRFFLFGCSSFPSPFFTFAYSSSSFAWIIQRFLHLRSIVNNKLLVFAQPIDKAAIMLAKFIPCTYWETTLFSLYRTDDKFVNLRVFCFHHQVSSVYARQRNELICWRVVRFACHAANYCKMRIHGFRSFPSPSHTFRKMNISYCVLATAKSFHSA
jgi:hypothetical protein